MSTIRALLTGLTGLAVAVPLAAAPPAAQAAPTLLEDRVPVTSPEIVAPPPGVLSNDTYSTTPALSVVDPPDHGTVTLRADGGFTYRPDPAFHGLDAWTYEAIDEGGARATAVATMVVNRWPVAANDALRVKPGVESSVAAPGVLGNDPGDADGDPVRIEMGATPSHGTVTLNADGSFRYTPNAGYVGLDDFTYRLTDDLWPGELALVRIAVGDVWLPDGPGEGRPLLPVTPAFPGAGPPAPGAPPAGTGGTPTRTPTTVVVPRTLRVDRRGRAVLGLVCKGPGACGGRFRVTTRSGRAIVSGAYELPAGKRSNTAIRVGPQGRAILRAARGRALKARLTVTPDGGKAKATALTVRAPRSLRR